MRPAIAGGGASTAAAAALQRASPATRCLMTPTTGRGATKRTSAGLVLLPRRGAPCADPCAQRGDRERRRRAGEVAKRQLEKLGVDRRLAQVLKETIDARTKRCGRRRGAGGNTGTGEEPRLEDAASMLHHLRHNVGGVRERRRSFQSRGPCVHTCNVVQSRDVGPSLRKLGEWQVLVPRLVKRSLHGTAHRAGRGCPGERREAKTARNLGSGDAELQERCEDRRRHRVVGHLQKSLQSHSFETLEIDRLGANLRCTGEHRQCTNLVLSESGRRRYLRRRHLVHSGAPFLERRIPKCGARRRADHCAEVRRGGPEAHRGPRGREARDRRLCARDELRPVRREKHQLCLRGGLVRAASLRR